MGIRFVGLFKAVAVGKKYLVVVVCNRYQVCGVMPSSISGKEGCAVMGIK